MEKYYLNGKAYKVFSIHAFGNDYKVIVTKANYQTTNGLALLVHDVTNVRDIEPLGTLTTNLNIPLRPEFQEKGAFVKNWSENSEWADNLAKQIGGKSTGITARSGNVTVPFYDFSELDIYAE